jgi:hypothetical protein
MERHDLIDWRLLWKIKWCRRFVLYKKERRIFGVFNGSVHENCCTHSMKFGTWRGLVRISAHICSVEQY